MACRNHPCLVGALAAYFCLSAMPASAQLQPPMLPGEVLAFTKNGCGVIFDGEGIKRLPEPYNDVEKRKNAYSEDIWTGACVGGLLEGRGQLAPASPNRGFSVEQEFFRGRALRGKQFIMSADGRPARVTYFIDGASTRSVEISDVEKPYSPVWPPARADGSAVTPDGTRIKGLDGIAFSTIAGSCHLDLAAFPDCGARPYAVYGVATSAAVWSMNSTKYAWCPNPRTPVGCEALWESKTRSVIDQIKQFAAEVEQIIEAKKEKYADLSLPFEERASTKRAAREAEAKQREIRAAEQLREKQERDAKEAESAVIAAQNAKAAADKRFQASLLKLNAGELFVLATKLDREGNADNALEARSALVSRFPNHALAATAAQQMAATSSGSSQSAIGTGGATSSAPSSLAKSAAVSSASPPKYASVCERNLAKLFKLMSDRKIANAAASWDLFLRDFNLDGAKILEPCIGASASAARTYEAAMDKAKKITQYCAGPHDKRLECRQWGNGASENQGNPYDNRAWYTAWKADVDRALADPANFSAELGTAAGANTSTATSADVAADSCAAKLKTVEASFNAAQPNIPKNSVTVLSEATMWMLNESINIIESTCPKSVTYRGQAAQFRQTLSQTKQVCDRSSARPCIAQLPGREPAPPLPHAAPTLKPLENKPPSSCEPSSSTGLSFTSCAREACAKDGGSFAIGSSGCAGCTRAGGSWTLCPKGSGGVSSAQ